MPGDTILLLRSLVIIVVLMTSLSSFADEQNVIHFEGGILALPLKAVSRCINDAIERKISETCSGEDEGATIVYARVRDYKSTSGDKIRREIVLEYN